MEFELNINQKTYQVNTAPETPLLWVIRDVIGLTGTKFGCGMAMCGACTVHVDGSAIRACSWPASAAIDKKITTIEGIAQEEKLHPVQQAWLDVDVAQCGYCQAGQIMSAVALLEKNNDPSEEEIEKAMKGNICRCGTYTRIKKAINQAAKQMNR